jgi:hypothetical protein
MAVPNIPNLILSNYLIKNCNLWIWDFDDTIITTEAYLKHNMDDTTISNLTDDELQEDVPHYKYFKEIVKYLYIKGRKIGIASFGVYTIIQAYMNRIFGMNQKYFDTNNIKAFRKDRNDADIRKRLPLNKNSMIYDIMQFYKISTFNNVCLFDDAPSNIADAMAIGVIAIQIDCLFNPEIMSIIDAKFNIETSNTHPLFYSDGQRKIWKHIPIVNGEAVLCNPDVSYKPIGDTKKCLRKKLPIDTDLGTVADIIATPTLVGKMIIKKNTQFTSSPTANLVSKISINHQTKNSKSNKTEIEGFQNFLTCLDCNNQLNKTINLIVLIGLIICLVIFIWRIHQSNDTQIMMVWSMILIFVILTLCLTFYKFKFMNME